MVIIGGFVGSSTCSHVRESSSEVIFIGHIREVSSIYSLRFDLPESSSREFTSFAVLVGKYPFHDLR